MAANVQQVQLRGRYQQIIEQDRVRGRLIDAFENDDADTLQWQVHLALNIKHRLVLLTITCVLVGAESWQREATKNGKNILLD